MAEDLAQSIERTLQEFRQKSEALEQDLAQELAQQARGASAAAAAELEAARRQSEDDSAAFAQNLAAAVRRIRAEDSVTGIATALVEGAARFCGRSALFIHRGDQLLGFRLAGKNAAERQEAFQRLSIPIAQATAIGHAIDSLEATVSDGGAGQMSQQAADLLGLAEDDRVHLYPIALREKVLAVLACDAGGAGVSEEGGGANDAAEGSSEPDASGPDEADPNEKGLDETDLDQAAAAAPAPQPLVSPAIEVLVALAEAWIEAVGTRRKQTAA